MLSACTFIGLMSLAADPPAFELEGNALKVPTPIVFQTGKADLATESMPALKHVVRSLEAKSAVTTLRVEVHSDDVGDAAANQRLTQARAAEVVHDLVALGVACERLIAVGFGGTKPAAPNDTPENRSKNRRTVFVNAALRGRPIGGLPLDGGGVVASTRCKQPTPGK
jgi:OOP family OmpA-OmpF porin